jgi:hypothetical protein
MITMDVLRNDKRLKANALKKYYEQRASAWAAFVTAYDAEDEERAIIEYMRQRQNVYRIAPTALNSQRVREYEQALKQVEREYEQAVEQAAAETTTPPGQQSARRCVSLLSLVGCRDDVLATGTVRLKVGRMGIHDSGDARLGDELR